MIHGPRSGAGAAGRALSASMPAFADKLLSSRVLLVLVGTSLWLVVRVFLPLIHVPIEEGVSLFFLRKWLSVPELLMNELMLVFVSTVCSANIVDLHRIHGVPIMSSLTRRWVEFLGAFGLFNFGIAAVLAAMLVPVPGVNRPSPPHVVTWAVGIIVLVAIALTACTDYLQTNYRSSSSE
jgi:hypothetical protein